MPVTRTKRPKLQNSGPKTAPAPTPSAAPAAPGSRSGGALLAGVGLLAFIVRLLVGFGMLRLPLVRSPQLDSLEYVRWAGRLAAGNWRWPTPPPHGPLYPFFLAAVFRWVGRDLHYAVAIQALIGALTCVCATAIARRAAGTWAAAATGALLAINGPLAFVDTSVFAEGLLMFFCVSSIMFAGLPSRRAWAAPLGGFLLGLGALARPTALVLVPVGLYLVLASRPYGQVRIPWRRAGTFLASAAIPVFAVTLVNIRAGCGPILVQGSGGLNFDLGNWPHRTGAATERLGGAWEHLSSEARFAGVTVPAEQDRYYTKKTIAEIRRYPSAYARVLLDKLACTLQSAETRDTFSYGFFQKQFAPLRFLPGFGLLLSLAVAGLFLGARREPDWRAAALAAGLFLATCIALLVGTRYRIPAVPFLAVLAGCGCAGFGDAIRDRDGRRILAFALPVAVLWPISHLTVHLGNRTYSEEWAATGDALVGEHDLAGAKVAFEKSIRENPASPLGWRGLGEVFFDEGMVRHALVPLRRAVAMDPDYGVAHAVLGTVYAALGDCIEAVPEFRAAIVMDPNDGSSRLAVGQCDLALSRADDAEKDFADLLRLDPASGPAERGLAQIDLNAGRLAGALSHARRSTELAPGDGSSWLVLGAAATASGDFPLAQSALQSAAQRGASEESVALASVRLYHAEGRRDLVDSTLRDLINRDPANSAARAMFLANARESGTLASAIAFLRRLPSAEPPGQPGSAHFP